MTWTWAAKPSEVHNVLSLGQSYIASCTNYCGCFLAFLLCPKVVSVKHPINLLFVVYSAFVYSVIVAIKP